MEILQQMVYGNTLSLRICGQGICDNHKLLITLNQMLFFSVLRIGSLYTARHAHVAMSVPGLECQRDDPNSSQ